MNQDIDNYTTDSNYKSLLSTTGKFGLKGAKYFSGVFVLFGLLNIIFFSISIFKLKVIESMPLYITGVVLVFLIGVGLTALAGYFTYKYLIIDGLKHAYKQMSPFFRKLSGKIVEQSGKVVDNNIKKEHREKALNIGNMISEIYGRKVPRYVRRGISFIVNRIPYSDLILNIRDTIQNGDKDEASNLLYNEIDNYITYSILGNNSMKWIYWLLPLNIFIQILAIYLFQTYF